MSGSHFYRLMSFSSFVVLTWQLFGGLWKALILHGLERSEIQQCLTSTDILLPRRVRPLLRYDPTVVLVELFPSSERNFWSTRYARLWQLPHTHLGDGEIGGRLDDTAAANCNLCGSSGAPQLRHE